MCTQPLAFLLHNSKHLITKAKAHLKTTEMEFIAKTTTTPTSPPPFSHSLSSSISSPSTAPIPSPNSHHLSNYSSPHAANSNIATNPFPTYPSPPPPPPVVLSPCAACKILRRRCVEKCVLAPYFPPTEPLKFTIAHRVFGASNIIKLLQEIPESHRADAVSSMVYEANARIRDPVYGCAGAICQLQKQVGELQAQLAKAQAELVNMQCEQGNLIALICMDMTQSKEQAILQQQQSNCNDTSCFPDENNLGTTWGASLDINSNLDLDHFTLEKDTWEKLSNKVTIS